MTIFRTSQSCLVTARQFPSTNSWNTALTSSFEKCQEKKTINSSESHTLYRGGTVRYWHFFNNYILTVAGFLQTDCSGTDLDKSIQIRNLNLIQQITRSNTEHAVCNNLSPNSKRGQVQVISNPGTSIYLQLTVYGYWCMADISSTSSHAMTLKQVTVFPILDPSITIGWVDLVIWGGGETRHTHIRYHKLSKSWVNFTEPFPFLSS